MGLERPLWDAHTFHDVFPSWGLFFCAHFRTFFQSRKKIDDFPWAFFCWYLYFGSWLFGSAFLFYRCPEAGNEVIVLNCPLNMQLPLKYLPELLPSFSWSPYSFGTGNLLAFKITTITNHPNWQRLLFVSTYFFWCNFIGYDVSLSFA